jgi:glc operon protein GlcG
MIRNLLLVPLSASIVVIAMAQAVRADDPTGTPLHAGKALSANLANQPTLTLEGAKRVAAAAIAYARSHAAPGGSVAIVDAGGHTLYLERLDGTFAAAAEVSVGKARTAVHFQKATRDLEDAINKGRPALLPVSEVTWFTPLQGGVPIVVDGKVVGGIGVSGALSQQQDEEVAIAGAQALAQTKGAK